MRIMYFIKETSQYKSTLLADAARDCSQSACFSLSTDGDLERSCLDFLEGMGLYACNKKTHTLYEMIKRHCEGKTPALR